MKIQRKRFIIRFFYFAWARSSYFSSFLRYRCFQSRMRWLIAPEFLWLLASSEVRPACSSIPRVGHPAGRSLRGRMDRLRLRRHLQFRALVAAVENGRQDAMLAQRPRRPDWSPAAASPGVNAERVATGCAAFVPGAVWCGPPPQQKQYYVKKGVPAFTSPQAQGSTGLVVAFKARHASAITDAIMGQPRGTDQI
jgi:hypothetical protein